MAATLPPVRGPEYPYAPVDATPVTAPAYDRPSHWSAARALALVGGLLGLLMAGFLLGAASMADGVNDPYVGPANPFADAWRANLDGLGPALGSFGVLHLVLAALVLGSAWALPGNPKVHGGLLVLWGLLGLLLGFGMVLGAILVLVGGALALIEASGTRFGGDLFGRRPVT